MIDPDDATDLQAGVIAAKDAGPAVTLSWGIAGFACVLTGFAYMEVWHWLLR